TAVREDSPTATLPGLAIYRKVAVAADAGATITETMTGGTPSGIIGTVATYRTAHTGIAYVAIGGGSSASGTSMADDVVSTAFAGAGLFVRFFGIASNAGSFTTS